MESANATAASVTAPRNPCMAYLASLVPTSAIAQRSRLKAMVQAIGWTEGPERFPWHQLTPVQTSALRTWLGKNYAPSTANCTLSALKGVLYQCYRFGLMAEADYKLACDLKRIRGERLPAGRSVGRAELRAIFEAALSSGRGIDARDAAIVAILYGAGLRGFEAAGLDLEDVGFGDKTLRVKGKGNKHRLVYVPQGTLDAVTAYLEHRGRDVEPEPALFWATRGRAKLYPKRIAKAVVRHALQRLARHASVAHLTPHDLRRSFVGDLLDAGADIATVAKLAGHASVNTTMVYDRRGEETKAKAAELIDVPFGGLVSPSRHA